MPEPTVSFEMKFAQVADVHLNDRVPTLAPYKVGYQVLDKTEDDTRAFGISAYIVDDRWLYIPVFFVDGKLKGSEMMYVKDLDIIVPAMDNWVAHLRTQSVSEAGKPVDRHKDEHLDTPPEVAQMDMKLAGDMILGLDDDPESLIDSTTCRRMFSRYNTAVKYPDLTEVPSLGKVASRRFIDTFLNCPDFTNALLRFYTPDDIQKVAHECAKVCTETPEDKPDALRIYGIRDKEAADLADSEKQLLNKHGIYIRDERRKLSKVFHTEVKSDTIGNITQPGMYDVLLTDGDFRTFIVIQPKDADSLDSRNCPKPAYERSEPPGGDVALIDPKKPAVCHIVAKNRVFGRPVYDVNGLLDSPEDAQEKGKDADMPTILATLRKHQDRNLYASRILLVKDKDNSISVSLLTDSCGASKDKGIRTLYNDRRVHIVSEDGILGLVSDTSDFRIPKGTRMFVVEELQDVLGDMSDIQCALEKTAGLDTLDVFSDGGLTAFDTGKGISQPMRLESAVNYLTRSHGIYAGQAVNMLKEASRESTRRKRYLVKHASAYRMSDYEGTAPMLEGQVPVRTKDALTETTATSSGKKQQNVLPQQVIDKATAAGEAGIREVFDVEVLKGLLDKADLSEVRKDFTSRMMQGMDATGRMLFLLYWHMDMFEDRFGGDDTGQMEDNLKETFLQLGDLILFIKDKNIDGENTADAMDGLLSEDIGSAG